MDKGEIDLIQDVLSEASAIVAEKYARRESLEVGSKTEPNDLITEADLAAQDLIAGRIGDAFPNDKIVAEESGMHEIPMDGGERCWFIDPIDGTQNFVSGIFPVFAISIAFARASVVQAAGVALPILGTNFLAEKGAGAFRDGTRLRVSSVDSLPLARLEVDFGSLRMREEGMRAFCPLAAEVGQFRSQGSAVVSLCSVAGGESEAYGHVGLSSWDYAAGMLLVEEAGGRCTQMDGAPVSLMETSQSIIASNGAVHNELLSNVHTS